MNITSFKVSEDKSTLLLSITDAATVSSLYLWDKETFKVQEYKVDLSAKLTGTANQDIIITPGDIGVSYFDGVYFVEAIDGSATSCKIAAELTKYKECILDKVLESKDCESCLEITYPEVLNSQTLLYTLEKAVELNLIQEVLTLIFTLDKFCSNDCKGCGEFKNI